MIKHFCALALAVLLLLGVAQQTLAQTPNTVEWKTPYAYWGAGDFAIRIGDKYFTAQVPVTVRSDPGNDQYTTLEIDWTEHGVPMRLYAYFRLNPPKYQGAAAEWELYELRTYDGSRLGNWIYFKPTDSWGNPVINLPGEPNHQYERRFTPIDGSDAEIITRLSTINAFLKKDLSYPAEYALEAMIGLPAGQIISLSTDPMTGYGVNVLLRDAYSEIVLNQADVEYKWRARNPELVEIVARPLEFSDGSCSYGMLPPCPAINAQLRGLQPGYTSIDVSAVRGDTILASTQFDIEVTDPTGAKPSRPPTPSVTPKSLPVAEVMPSPTFPPVAMVSIDPADERYEQLTQEIEKLETKVGVLELENQTQAKQISLLEKLVRSLQQLVNRLKFWD